MKILCIIPSFPKYSGVDYHRLVQPHRRISELFPDDAELFQITEIDSATVEFLKGFDICVANRFISKQGDSAAVIQKLKEAKLPFVIDLDDDYKLPEWHILHHISKKDSHAIKIIHGLNHATAITTTHEQLAQTLKRETTQKNVYIVPNGIYPEDQFEIRPVELDRITFGWSGSVTHFEDVLELFDALLAVYVDDDYSSKMRMVYGGYSGDDPTSRAIAGVLSARGKAPAECFATFPSSGPKEYANFYDKINISLIPLRNNRFNNMKSNLKLIEAGFKKKAAIVSDVFPYSPMLKHGINCLKVKTRHDWYRNMVKLIKNPNMITDLAERLYEDVQVQHIDIIAETRLNAYKNILR